MTGGWRKLHSEELLNLHFSPDIIRVIKFRRLRWAGHAVCMEEMSSAYNIFVGKPEGDRPSKNEGIDGWIILKCILEK
jgi:hypothetical protein